MGGWAWIDAPRGAKQLTLHLLVVLARILLMPVLVLASLASARIMPPSPALLLWSGYAASLLGFAAWPRRSLRRVSVPITGWLVVCWAIGIPRGSDGAELGAILAGCLACALPRAVRDFQRLARSREHMDPAELRIARRRASRPSSRMPQHPAGAVEIGGRLPPEGGHRHAATFLSDRDGSRTKTV